MARFELAVNGVNRQVTAQPEDTLLGVLRGELGLAGPRFGCGLGQCGACYVLLDGRPVASCDLPMWSAAGRAVTTVEGLAETAPPHPLQAAFLAEQAAQCGYCTTGILISAAGLLEANPHPTEAEIVAALDRHLCRCGVHQRIVRAVARASAAEEGPAAAGPTAAR